MRNLLPFYCDGIFHSWNVLSGLSLVHKVYAQFQSANVQFGRRKKLTNELANPYIYVISIQEHGQLTNDIVLHYHMNA